MKRAAVLVATVAAVTAFLVPAGPASAADDAPVWTSPLALGPSDATSVAARPGLVIAGGRVHLKDEKERPSPRVAGIFVSTDDGRSWTRGRLAGPGDVIERTPDVVGVPLAGHDAYALFGAEVWRSEDDGVTWRKVSNLSGPASTLDFHPDGRVLAGLAAGGLQVSADRGETWAAFGTGLPTARVNEIVLMTDSIVLAATDSGLYRSTNAGAAFSAVSLPGVTAGNAALGVAGIFGRGSLGAFVAVPATGLNGTNVYTSTNDGSSWTPRGPIVSGNFTPRVNKGALEFAVHGSISSLYAGTNTGLHKADFPTAATNGWTRFEPEPGLLSIGDLASYDFEPSPNIQQDVVFATVARASIFISSSTPVGRRMAAPGWFDELEGGRVCGGLVVHKSGDLIAACGRHVLRSSDAGATWMNAGSGLPYIGLLFPDLPYMPLEQTADGSLWTSGYYYGLYKSDSTVSAWNRVPYPGVSVGAMGAHPTNAGTLFASGQTTNGSDTRVIWKTTDSGQTWKAVYSSQGYVYNIDVAQTQPTRAVAAVFGNSGGVVYSTDTGETWASAGGIPSGSDYSTNRAVFSPIDANLVWAVVTHYLPGSNAEWLLYRSTNGGQTFSQVGTLPQGAIVWADALKPSLWDADTLYVESATFGTMVNRSGGASDEWTFMNTGLVGPYFSNLTFDPAVRGRLWATDGVLSEGAPPHSQWVFRGTDPGV